MGKLIVSGVLVLLLVPLAAWGKIGGGDITFHPSGAGNVLYSHDFHVGKLGLKCTECHSKIFIMSVQANAKRTMADMQRGLSCGACHNGKRAFDVKSQSNCAKCHQQ
jgi:c(7)-type cytochrome triheme protein